MKYMRLGTRPDTFYSEEATRTVASDFPRDLVIRVNKITYLLHKFSLLPKCGLLQRLFCDDSGGSSTLTVDLDDIPGSEEAFELCAKFCYGIAIDLSAHNFVSVFCAAKFLGMTEVVEHGNLITKLEAFFHSCILQGWKDSLVTLQSTANLPEWSENLGIIRRCIDSVVEKILTPPSKVTWSYTYTRPGYPKKQRQSTPRDWWTEDISNLNIDIFRCIVAAIKSRNLLPPQLIGEALHVYACRWLPDVRRSSTSESSTSQKSESVDKKRTVLETIVSLIPAERESVSVGFLVKLLSISNHLGLSPVMTKAELVRRSALQLEEATVNDILLTAQFSPHHQQMYDVDLIKKVLESYLECWRHQSHAQGDQSILSIRRVGELIDTYLQVVARDVNVPVTKIASLAESLPDDARPTHDGLYKAIDIYLKEHPHLSKEEKKNLCRILDCQKLSPEVRAHLVKNERLPLRTIVQGLFFEQARGMNTTSSKLPVEKPIAREKMQTKMSIIDSSKPRQGRNKREITEQDMARTTPYPGDTEGQHSRSMKSAEKPQLESEKMSTKRQVKGEEPQREKQIEEEEEEEDVAASKSAAKKLTEGTRGKLDVDLPKKLTSKR